MAAIDIEEMQIFFAVLVLDALENLETCSVYHIFRVKNKYTNALNKQSMALAKVTK